MPTSRASSNGVRSVLAIATVPFSKRKRNRPANGLFGIGWIPIGEFPGLLDRLNGYQAAIADRLRDWAGMLSTPHRRQSPEIREAAERFRREGV